MSIFKKTMDVLLKDEKFYLFVSFILILIITLIDLATTALIYPLINSILNNKKTFDLIGLNFFESQNNNNTFIIINLIVIFYFIKAMVSTFKVFFLENKLAMIQARITFDFYKYYLNKSLVFINKQNSSILIRNIHNEVANFTTKNLPAILNIGSDVLLFIGISLILIYVKPLASLIIIIFFSLLGYLFAKKTKKNNLKYGELRAKFLALLTKHLFQTFHSFKIIKLNQKEKFFYNLYKNFSTNEILAKKNQLIIQNLPKIWLEFFGIFTISIIALSFSFMNISFSNTFSYLGLFLFSMFRILPSLNRILQNIQALRFGNISLKIIQDHLKDGIDTKILKEKEIYSDEKFTFSKEIKIKNVSFSYPDRKEIIFNNFDYKINKNTIVGISGKSGVGKSTLIDLICGLLKPSKGEILIDEKNLEMYKKTWQTKIGYVPQDVYLLDDTIKNNIAFGELREDISQQNINKAIEGAGLDKLIKKLPDGINTVVGEKAIRISGGQKQRIGIARALYNLPELLIMDESTNSLDKDTENNILETLKKLKKNCTILMISHKQNSLQISDEILSLEKILK